MIELINVSNLFDNPKEKLFEKKTKFHALKDISLTIDHGVTCIVGESGSGKSTLALHLAGLINADQGQIYYDGEDLKDLQKTLFFRKNVQIIFQNSSESFNPLKTILWNLLQPIKVHFPQRSEKEHIKEIKNLLLHLGLTEHYLNQYPAQLSGGQAQRMAILSSLLLEPEYLICDEITSSLDVSIQAQIINLLLKLKQEYNLTIIFITHDLTLAEFIGDKIIIMKAGEVIEYATCYDIFHNSSNEYTKELINANITLGLR